MHGDLGRLDLIHEPVQDVVPSRARLLPVQRHNHAEAPELRHRISAGGQGAAHLGEEAPPAAARRRAMARDVKDERVNHRFAQEGEDLWSRLAMCCPVTVQAQGDTYQVILGHFRHACNGEAGELRRHVLDTEIYTRGLVGTARAPACCFAGAFSQLAMGRISAEFCAAYPEVTFEVVAEDRLVDLVEEQFDTVIRKDCAGLSAWRCSRRMECRASLASRNCQSCCGQGRVGRCREQADESAGKWAHPLVWRDEPSDARIFRSRIE